MSSPAHLKQAAGDSMTMRQRVRSVMSACAGNLIEWYDFFVYAYTAIYFAASFFPEGDTTSQLLSTAAIFAVGFFMRPLGGWIFGRLADKRGRKVAMVISVGLMCASSLLIAVLPTYAMIGYGAPALLLIARLAQGLSVGAEYGAGATYISEVATKGRRALFGSFQYMTIVAGQLLALLTIIILQNVLTADQLSAWGWRIPFLIGAFGAIVVIYLRRSMVETASKSSMARKEAGSVRAMLKSHPRAVALVIFFTIGGSLYFYTFTTYMQKFLVLSTGIDKETASLVMSAALVGFMLLQPVFGLLCDKIGVKTHMLLFSGLAAVTVVPLLYAIQGASSPLVAFGLILAGLTVAAFYTPIAGLVKAEMFPIEVRALGVGLPYAVGNAAFGGTAEYVALWLRQAGIEPMFFYYVAAITSLTFLAALMMPNLSRHGYLDGDGQVEANTGGRLFGVRAVRKQA